jgi:hypothetical protein
MLFMRPTLYWMLCVAIVSCAKPATKNSGGGTGPTGPTGGDTVITTPVDPAVSATVGFFLNDWQAKSFTAPSATTAGPVATDATTDSLKIDLSRVLTKVSPYVYGNNTNLWIGQIVTQPSLMGYIKDLNPHVLRGPGGSTSDIYFWNQSTNPPADAPAQIYSNGALAAPGYWYGQNTQSWTLDLTNYYQLQVATSSTGMMTMNYGYARYGTGTSPVDSAAHLAANWVRLDAGKSKFWEIGNETYGNWEAGYQIDQTQNQDGQAAFVTGDLYGQHVKIFADSMRAAAQETGATIYIGASLVDGPAYQGAYSTLVTWNQGVLGEVASTVDFYIVHDYFTAYNANSTAAQILSTADSVPPNAMAYLKAQMSQYGASQKPIALTEWNIQAVGSKQDVSFIAGVHAVKALGSIIKNGFGEASRWDLGNGYNNGDDMGMFNVGDEPGVPQWNPRPAFYYLYYFQQFFGDRMVYDTLKAINGDLTTYSSSFSNGAAGTVIINSGTTPHNVAIDFKDFAAGTTYYWYVLTGGTDNGQLSSSVYVNGNPPTNATGGPTNYSTLAVYSAPLKGTINVDVPSRAVVFLVAAGK